jgi:dolichol-phosphate mannosyltransferase
VRDLFARLYTEGEGSVPELATYYDFTYADAPNNPLVAIYERWLDAIERERRPGRILDIGCGTGLFLAVARRRGWEPYGVDDCGAATAHARDHFGLDVWDGQFSDFAAQKSLRFDAISMWDIIEHARAPVALLGAAREVLAPGGVIGISTPNQQSILDVVAGLLYRASRGRITRPLEKFYIEQHFLYFSPRTLRDALSRAGLAAVRLDRELTELRRLSLSPAKRLVLEALFAAARLTGLRIACSPSHDPPELSVLSCAASMRALVVLPTYNEAENVLPLSADVLARDAGLAVLVVDDNSPDAPAISWRTRGAPSRVSVSCAVRARWDWAPRISTASATPSRATSTACSRWTATTATTRDISRTCWPSRRTPTLVIGSRYVPGGGIANWPLRRRLLSRFANFYTRWLLRLPVRDCTAGFRCYSRSVLEAIDPFSVSASGYSFLEEMVWRVHHAGFSIREIPIVFEDRRRGSSKIDQVEIFRAARHVLATAFRRPHTAAQIARRSSSSTTG